MNSVVYSDAIVNVYVPISYLFNTEIILRTVMNCPLSRGEHSIEVKRWKPRTLIFHLSFLKADYNCLTVSQLF